MKRTNETKGITLIALIITIIVLLILAGVTISAITGNESVMEKAKEAKEKTDISNEKEAMQLAIINYRADNEYLSDMNQEKIASAISEYVESSESIVADEDHFDVTTKKGNEYIIKANGTVLSNEDLEKEMDSYVSFTVINTIENVDNRKVRITVNSSLININCTIVKTGIVFMKGSSITKELIKENVDDNIKYYTVNRTDFAGTFIDDMGGAFYRPAITIQYGNHTHVVYGNVGYTTFEEVLANQS